MGLSCNKKANFFSLPLLYPRMKRRGDHSVPSRKIARKSSFNLVKLPNDVIQSVFQYLAASDIINLASTCHDYRNELIQYLYSNIKVRWNDLIDIREKLPLVLNRYASFIKYLRIIDYYSYGEWQIDIFQNVLTKLPNLRGLLVNSINSSNWLKYRTNSKIEKLTLYFDISANCPLPHQTQVVSTNPKIFHLAHIANFSRLTHLNLSSYHFNWDPSDLMPENHLQSLTIENCTWEYPFQLSQFNHYNTLNFCQITYSNNNPFILSERFTNFLNDPLNAKSTSLQTLFIEFKHYDDINWKKHLSLKQFQTLIDPSKFPHLQCILLHGWLFNLRSFMHYVNQNFLKLEMTLLDLLVEVTDSDISPDNFQSFRQSALRSMTEHHPNVRFKLDLQLPY